MLEQMSHNILYEYSYVSIYILVLIYFLFLYFGLAPIFNKVCNYLARKGTLEKINMTTIKPKQLRFEIKNSIVSIIVFGFSIFPIIYLARISYLNFSNNNILNIVVGLVLLNLWNEIHFYIVHRAMHIPFFMKHVHVVHHKSVIPTVYSVFSFHWLEAVLLSTVPLTAVLFLPLAPVSIFLYPITSILLNFAGHCNYRSTHQPFKLLNFASRHSSHHKKGRGNIGFALNILDRLFTPKKK